MKMGVSSDECHHFRGMYLRQAHPILVACENWMGLWGEEWWDTLETTSYDKEIRHTTRPGAEGPLALRRDAVRGCALRLQGLDCPWLASSRDDPVDDHTDQASDDGGYDVKPHERRPKRNNCLSEHHECERIGCYTPGHVG